MREGFHQTMQSGEPRATANEYMQYLNVNEGMHIDTRHLLNLGAQIPIPPHLRPRVYMQGGEVPNEGFDN